MKNQWIWLPEKVYPHNQNTVYDDLSGYSHETYTVAEFKKRYVFEKGISKVNIRFSADTEVQLFCNGRIIATGPSVVGGDFLANERVRGWYYANEVSLTEFGVGFELDLFARVKMCPTRLCEYSKGHGGFMLCAEIIFDDGSCESVYTDDSWLVRKNGAYVKSRVYDGNISPDEYIPAEIIDDIWLVKDAPIPVRKEEEICVATVRLAPNEEISRVFSLDMIYAGFLHLSSEGEGAVSARLVLRETDEEREIYEQATLKGNDEYRSFFLDSAGNISLVAKNESESEVVLKIGFITTFYPVTDEAETVTSDECLNKLLKVCKHTLKYCRQTHHLDSPRHCEPLACTGDYYIEALMTAFSFGDMRLAEFDIERTAEELRHNDGRLFHTTYSLIWVRMLYDVYMMSGRDGLLHSSVDALDLLLKRFASYVGENGLIENPPDYMFVDWIYIDGLSMHHPPKALGQTVLNMFYFMALDYAERIYTHVGEDRKASLCNEKKESLRKSINALLYDAEKKMYFEGLNTKIDEKYVHEWQPQNVEKRYYLKHSNILAAYTSVCDSETARMLIEKVVEDDIEGEIQPYFLHYLLEAICTHGLREKYMLRVLERWKEPVRECDKGLVEGFVAPEPTYSFDHSHAWAGSPLYSLPKALMGLSVSEAGYKKIKLRPSLLGLDSASVELLTPYGSVYCRMESGSEPVIDAPDEIEIEIQTDK